MSLSQILPAAMTQPSQRQGHPWQGDGSQRDQSQWDQSQVDQVHGDEFQRDESQRDEFQRQECQRQKCQRHECQQLLFVYGSLKRGQRGHQLLQGLPWHGEAWLSGACLHNLGPFPMAVPGEGRIQGELYGVGETDLVALDRYEGVPRLYERHWLNLEDGRGAWVYLGRPHQVRHVAPLASGCWLGPSDPKLRRTNRSQALATAIAKAPSRAIAKARVKARTTVTATFTALTQALSLVLVIAAGLRPGWAFDTLGACQSWQNSRGQARIEVANSIGAGHYLTKMKRLQESDPEAPVQLYSEGDIARVCSER